MGLFVSGNVDALGVLLLGLLKLNSFLVKTKTNKNEVGFAEQQL